MQDALGTRMKENYEFITKYKLPRHTYTVIRVDGVNFHNYTKHLDKPFSAPFQEAMINTAKWLCQEIHGTVLAFVESDEISLLLVDFANIHTEPWYGGVIQKMASVSAGMATSAFLFYRRVQSFNTNAYFDARVFTIPDPTEVANYFIWRQKDATRNSINMVAQSKFSHKQLQGASCEQMQEMLWQQHKINWNDYPTYQKRGTALYKVEDNGLGSKWYADLEIPVFTQEPEWLRNRIPEYKDVI